MEEKQNGLGEGQANEERKPEGEPSTSSREGGAAADPPAVKTPIEDPCDVVIGLKIVKALGDSLVCIHAAQTYGNVEPFDETIQTIGYLLIAKARCLAAELDLSIDD